MTPERAARLVARWVRAYTHGLAAPVARRRVEEIAADVAEQIADERGRGVDERRIARGVASRMLRGVAADVAWRSRQPKEERMVRKPVLRVALGVALVLSVPFVGMLVSDGVDWSVADFVLAGVLLAVIGTVLELAVRRTGNLVAALAVAALGVVAAVLGEADDAPGLVLLGILLVGSGCVLGARARVRSRSG